MSPEATYVCDADSLINLYRHFGRAALTVVRKLGKRGALKLPEGVVREIEEKTDKLSRFMKKHEKIFKAVTVQIKGNPRLREEVVRLERAYGETIRFGPKSYDGFWKSSAGKKAADAQVVAVAKELHETAVSNDRAVQLACSLESVSCIGWAEFARRIGLMEQLGLPLDQRARGGLRSRGGAGEKKIGEGEECII